MTNEEILLTPYALLGELDRQRQTVLAFALKRRPCPVCGAYANIIEAAGIALNDYTFGHESLSCRCARCEAELEQVVPLFGGQGWFWKRKGTGE